MSLKKGKMIINQNRNAMERYDRDRYDYDRDRWHDNRYDQDRRGRFDFRMRDNFDRDYYNRRDYNRHEDDNRFRNYRSYGEQERGRDDTSDFRGRQPSQGDLRRGYGISGYDGISDRFNTLNNPDNARDYGENNVYYGDNRGGFSSSSFGGGAGDSFPHSDRGVPNYGLRNFADNQGTGVGSSYGGTNYGGGTGYIGGHRGGSFGNTQYGSSSGNYGGFGSMSGSRGSIGDRTSHNSNRGSTELGGF